MVLMDRKHQILQAAQELIQIHGWTGFSYQDLSKELGIAKPSIHHHFPTKEALGLALIEGYDGMLDEIRSGLEARSDRAGDQLRAFLAFAGEDAAGHERALCPGGALHANYETFSPAMQEATRNLSERMHAWVTDLLERGRDQGDIRLSASASEAAWQLMSTLQGGRQFARTHGLEVWQVVVRQLEASLLISREGI